MPATAFDCGPDTLPMEVVDAHRKPPSALIRDLAYNTRMKLSGSRFRQTGAGQFLARSDVRPLVGPAAYPKSRYAALMLV
jgi:hypothetical protein